LHLINGLIVIAWIVCVVLWVKRGCPVPRWVHVLAIALTTAGAGVVIGCFVAGTLTTQLLLLCLLVPAPATYFGWLWMFGPEHTEKSE